MSIRSVHLAFIIISVGLSVIMTTRFAELFRADRGIGYAIAAALTACAAMVLAGYGIRYRYATRGMDGVPAPRTGRARR